MRLGKQKETILYLSRIFLLPQDLHASDVTESYTVYLSLEVCISIACNSGSPTFWTYENGTWGPVRSNVINLAVMS